MIILIHWLADQESEICAWNNSNLYHVKYMPVDFQAFLTDHLTRPNPEVRLECTEAEWKDCKLAEVQEREYPCMVQGVLTITIVKE